MSEYQLIEHHLRTTFEDFKLSNLEKASFGQLLELLENRIEKLNFARNKAFDIYRELCVPCNAVESTDFVLGLSWLEQVVKKIDSVRAGESISEPSAFFSPGTDCVRKIVDSILTAKESIDICVFTISDDQIRDAILKAHDQNKDIRIISDNYKAEDKGNDIFFLANKGIPVRLDRSKHHMHHKFAVFDQKVLINGSFNWTRSASVKNEENITVLHDPAMVNQFSEKFDELWAVCERVE